jgi:hypothetical protein
MIFCMPLSAKELRDLPEAEPYGENEFPEWLSGIRRAEIIAVGVFPFAFFASRLTYGIIRYGVNDFQQEYIPELVNPGPAVPLERAEKIGVVLAGVGLSLSVALIDFIILSVREKRAESDENTPVVGSE